MCCVRLDVTWITFIVHRYGLHRVMYADVYILISKHKIQALHVNRAALLCRNHHTANYNNNNNSRHGVSDRYVSRFQHTRRCAAAFCCCCCCCFYSFLFSLLLLFLVWFWLSQSVECSSNVNGISAHTHSTAHTLIKNMLSDFMQAKNMQRGTVSDCIASHRCNVKRCKASLTSSYFWKWFGCFVLVLVLVMVLLLLCCSAKACSEWKSFAQIAVCPCSNNNNHNEKIEMFNILFKNWIVAKATATAMIG